MMASHSAPSNVPLSDIDNQYWNERSERRTAALHQLKAVLKEKLCREQVPPPFWAFCQVADVSKLEEMVLIVQQAPNAKIAQLCLEPTIKDCDSAIARWLQNLNRSTTASRNCKERDQSKCVLTGWEEPDTAHIYTHSLIKASGREPRAVGRFWDILGLFWEEERVEQWKKEIFSDPRDLKAPKDGCFNMISLDKHPHALWGAGRFALRPKELSADLKELKVEFHWQPKPSHETEEIDLLTEPATSRGLYKYGGRGLPVPTGTYKEDDDPDKLPLPSWPLLEMQWHLQRIAGMSGAAEASGDLDHNDDDDDGKEMPTYDRDANVRSVRAIFEWLRLLPENEQSTPPPMSVNPRVGARFAPA
ncbi:hypothetical protein CPC735_035460 [Coccidioides posadasii C735 delta SOWgp]|uniref:HNH nuclease domain-containing protein n=1 Tax=Coccidioides posadasii (strain C735) TaxID=222929 RepID=C5P670_COCP7|nr:hypothetical protein CPC735_035460 [Coccidioides posadasii C735 delta SOWgp]EER28210.1 hypothetical protein CPC735_035460 [Coccidioides posadasii C735 delta SOWgp]|eukprot:XP_003070355.1 hypothetical protein CPC735_035460 [Coccidioides posadasii C735 delta SOWgp]